MSPRSHMASLTAWCLLVLALSGCGSTTQSRSPNTTVTPPSPPAAVVTPGTPAPNPQPTPPAPPAPPAPQPQPAPPPPPASINGRYLGQTVVSASTSIPGVGVPATTVQTEFNIAESDGAVTAIGKVTPADKPQEASDVTANGTRTGSSLKISLPFNPACSSVALDGTIQANSNIEFSGGQASVNCTINTFLGQTTVPATVTYAALTLVKQ